MTLIQWLALVAGVVVVGAIYFVLRNRGNTDPWRNMNEPPGAADESEAGDDAGDRGEGLGGDSYIVAVRTLTEDRTSPDPGEESQRQAVSASAASASWQAYKRSYASDGRGRTYPAPEREASPPPAAQSSPEADVAPAQNEPSDARPAPEPAPAERSGNIGQAPDTPHERRCESDAEPGPAANPAPPIDDKPGPAPEPGARPTPRERIEPQPRVTDDQEIFILHVAATDNRHFAGADVHAALADQGLRFGFNDIYHRVAHDGERLVSIYGVANMVNPGTLDPADQDQLETPGLTLFLIAPGDRPGPPTMREMMETANALAIALGGVVLDDRRAKLKAQTAQHVLDRIAELDRKAAVARRR